MWRRLSLPLVVMLVLVACGGSQNERRDTTSELFPSTTAAVTSTTSDEAPPTTGTAPPAQLTSVTVVGKAGLGGVIVPGDGLPFLVVDADGAVRTVKCLDETCATHEFGTSFSSRRGISFVVASPDLVIGPDGFPAFVYEDLDSEDGETARFNDRLPPDNRMHLVRCLDAGCTEITDTDLGVGLADSVRVLGDAPFISYWSYGQSWDDLRDWGRAKVISCSDPQCSERIETWIGELQNAWTQVLVGPKGLPVIAYGLSSGDEIGAVFCDDADCVSHERIAVAEDGAGTQLVGASMGDDGPMFAYRAGPRLYVVACLDDRCTEVGTALPVGDGMAYGSVQAVWRSGATPVFAFSDEAGLELDVAACFDVGCGDVIAVRVTETVTGFDLALDSDGHPVVFVDGVLIRCVDVDCRRGGQPSSVWNDITWDNKEQKLPPVMEGWHLAGVLGDRGGGYLFMVIEGGPGLVAFGQDCGLDRAGVPGCESKAWVSNDGREWQEADTLGKGEVRIAATNGSKILAGGVREFTDGGVESVAPALWLSSDGRQWTWVSTNVDLFLGCTGSDPDWCAADVNAIVPVDDGFWVMGRNASGPVAWVSDDGISWKASRYPLDAFDESSLTAGTFMNWAVAGGDGIVASGMTCKRGPVCDLLAATSVEGLTWHPLDPPAQSEGDITLYRPSTWSGGYVAVAEPCDLEGECILSMATSADAVNWQVESIDDAFAPVYVQTLHGFGEGLIGIGGLPNEGTGVADPVFIRTDDLTTWTMESGDPELFPPDRHAISDAIQYGDRFIAVGMTTDGPTVWWYGG